MRQMVTTFIICLLLETATTESTNFSEKSILRVLSTNNEPFMYRNKNGQFYQGIEYNLLQTIAEELSSKLSIRNWSNLSSAFSELRNNETDILVGGLFPGLTSIALATIPYQVDDITFCIQTVKNIPKLFHAFTIASPGCWLLAIFGYGFGSSIVVYYFIRIDQEMSYRKRYDFHYILWAISFSAFLGYPSKFKPIYKPLRLYYGMMLITGFLMALTVLAHFHQFVHYYVPGYQIKTIHEIVQNNFRLAGTQEVHNIIKHDTRFSKQQIDSFRICRTVDECLNNLSEVRNSDLAVGGSRQHILDVYSPSNHYCFDRSQRIINYHISMRTSDSFKSTPKINGIIRRLIEGGFVVRWQRDFSSKIKNRMIPTSSTEASMESLAFLFCFLYVLGMFLATLSFLAEKIIARKVAKKQKHWIWIHLERFFDGERYYLMDLPSQQQHP